jgi:hypothetical protein
VFEQSLHEAQSGDGDDIGPLSFVLQRLTKHIKIKICNSRYAKMPGKMITYLALSGAGCHTAVG